MTDILRKDNAKHVAAINKAWGHQVAWLEAEPGFEIKSTLKDGLSILYGRDWVPAFVTLPTLKREDW